MNNRNENIKFLCLASLMLIAAFAVGFFAGVDSATNYLTDRQKVESKGRSLIK